MADLSIAKQLLYQALSTPLGIVIETNDMERALARFYAARAEAKDEALEGLTLRRSAVDGEILILHNGKTGK